MSGSCVSGGESGGEVAGSSRFRASGLTRIAVRSGGFEARYSSYSFCPAMLRYFDRAS